MSGGGSAPAPAPAQQTVNQTSEFPDELKPYISDILERAKTRAEAEDAAGYQVYPAPRLAEFQAEQTEAQQGIAGIARRGIANTPYGASSTYMPAAYAATASSLDRFTPQAASTYMSPYIQSVVDIQKREAERQGDMQRQSLADQAVGAGSFGGSRQAFLEAEQARNEAQLLNDIQKTGMQSAYEQASGMFERQKARDLAGGAQFAGLAEQAPRLSIAEMGALSGVGQQKQEQSQRALDIGYQQFQEEQQYPDATLQKYSSIIRGFPLTPNQFDVKQTAAPAPNLVTQLAGAAATGAGIYGAFKAIGGRLASGGIARLAEGSTVGDGYDTEEEDILDEEDTLDNEDMLDDDISNYGGTFETQLPSAPSPRVAQATTPKEAPKDTPLSREVQSRLDENSALSQKIQASAEAQKAALEAKQKSIGQDKYLALMQGGLEMMQAGGEGKGLLTGIARGGKEALPAFRQARKDEQDVNAQLAGVDLDTALKSYGIGKDRIDHLTTLEKMDLLQREMAAKEGAVDASNRRASATVQAAGISAAARRHAADQARAAREFSTQQRAIMDQYKTDTNALTRLEAARIQAGAKGAPHSITSDEVATAKKVISDYAEALSNEKDAKKREKAGIVSGLPAEIVTTRSKLIRAQNPKISEDQAVEQAINQLLERYKSGWGGSTRIK